MRPDPPYTDKQIHGNKGNLVEHEHGEQVYRDEEPEHTDGKEGEPKEIFFSQRLQPPGGECSGKDNDGRKQQHGYRNTVYSYRIVDVECRIPDHVGTEQHFIRGTSVACIEVHHGQCRRKNQQSRCTGHHHRAYLCDVAAEPKTQQHQQGDEYE